MTDTNYTECLKELLENMKHNKIIVEAIKSEDIKVSGGTKAAEENLNYIIAELGKVITAISNIC